jgi:DNA end-binding protein Ku
VEVSRIRPQCFCPTCERVVERTELVRGYPVDGSYVILEGVEALQKATSRTSDLVAFVDAATVSTLNLRPRST